MAHYRKNVIKAVLNLKSSAITWPDAGERKRIARRFKKEYGWRNCVFIIDGTLFPLRNRPQTEDYADYYGRKLGYTINEVILCDDQRRIRFYLSGNPGTCHDQRAWRQTPICQQPEEFLDVQEYGIGDSAFEPDWFMVSAFSRPRNASMERPKAILNNKMKKPRVISEHVNGILKGRFPILTNLPNIIKDKNSMKECLKVIDCCMILHNLLVGMKDDIPDGWRDQFEGEISDISEAESINDDLDRQVPVDSPRDWRRNQILTYFDNHTI